MDITGFNLTLTDHDSGGKHMYFNINLKDAILCFYTVQ